MTGWVLTNLPGYFTDTSSWGVFWKFNADRAADLGSVWMMTEQMFDTTFTAHTINVVSWVFMGLWCTGVLVIGLRAPKTPRLAQLGLPRRGRLPAGQQGLLPAVRAVAAAARRARAAAAARPAGLAVDRAASTSRPSGGTSAASSAPASGGDAGFYWVAITLRVLGELYLSAVVVRDILRPEHDPVEREDPADVREPDEEPPLAEPDPEPELVG